MEELKEKIKTCTKEQFDQLLDKVKGNPNATKYLLGIKVLNIFEELQNGLENAPKWSLEKSIRQFNSDFNILPGDKLYTHTRKSFKDIFQNEVIENFYKDNENIRTFNEENGIQPNYDVILSLIPSTHKIVLFDGSDSDCNCDFDVIEEFNKLYGTNYDYVPSSAFLKPGETPKKYPYDKAMDVLKRSPELRFDLRFIELVEKNKNTVEFNFLKIGLIPYEAYEGNAYSIDIEFEKNDDEFLNIHYDEIALRREL